MNMDYYELRYIESDAKDSDTFSLFDEIEGRKTLYDFIQRNDKTFLLGNPGIGKTTELKYVFERIWEEIDEKQIIPFFINIRTFRRTSTLENLIPSEDWLELPAVVFVFDGLDEIADIQDFVSELENFIIKYRHLNIKYLISCRTNIYEKYLIKIENFEIVYLKYLSVGQIENILQEKFGLSISSGDLEKLESIMQTPFNLDLFANYHIENGAFPETLEESMELFINSEATRAKEKLVKRFSITESQILEYCSKVAFAAELLQRNSITESELYQILGEKGTEIFQELPFIEIQESGKDYNFRHKNYQEYFAAKYISKLEDDQIIEIISAEGLAKIKPALFNAVTFLLNIVKEEKFTFLRDWLLENDIEVLFFADENRLSEELKNQVFEKYYNDQCVDKTFWLTNSGKVKVDVLARYANFDFLVKEIKNKDRLDRNRISLVEILPYRTFSDVELNIVKDLFLQLFRSEESFFQSEILRAIKVSEMYKDSSFWNQILENVKDSADNAVTHQLISIFWNISEVDRDNDEVFQIISNHFKPQDDRVIRGTEQIVGNIMLATDDSEFFMKLIMLLFDEQKILKVDSIYSLDFKEKLTEKIIDFSEETAFKEAFLNFCFSSDIRLFSQEDLLSRVLMELGISDDEMLSLLKTKRVQEKSLYTLSRFFTKSSIDATVAAYISGDLTFIDEKSIQSIRNWMSHVNRELALHWQDVFLKAGAQFTDLLYTDDQIADYREKYEIFKERNFELLFDKKEFKKEIENFFTINNIDELKQPEFQKIFWKWYEETGYHGLRYSVHVVIEMAFQNGKTVNKTVNAQNLIELLDIEYFHLSVIKSMLTHNSALTYSLSESQKEIIKELGDKLEDKIDYENAVIINSQKDESFSTTIHQKHIDTLLFFDIRFNVPRTDDFYLNVLDKGNLIGSAANNEESNFVDFIKSRISDRAQLNEKVADNILENKLLYPAKRDHYEYAIKNDLEKCYPIMETQFIESDFLFFNNDLIGMFLEKIDNPLDFLKSCCTDITSHLCWTAIKLIKEKYPTDDFCLKVAREYLESNEINFADKAVNILFFFDQADSLLYYDKLIDTIIEFQGGDASGYHPPDANNYDQTNEIEFVEPLFYKVYVEKSKGSFYLHKSREFMRVLIANLGRSKEGYEQIKPILLRIKSDVKGKDSQSFYINHLIEILENAFLKENSQESSIEEITKILR